jgi:dolichol-phosphate mannosyltransferase
MSKKRIVVIIPAYNEGEALLHTIKALTDVRKKVTKYDLDLLFVNDGSRDNTQEVLEKAADDHSFVFYRQFSRNAGHQSALRAGLNAAVNYDAAIMMDADMQHPPELIPDMIAKWEEGFKVVQMVRSDDPRKAGLAKYILSRSFYVVINNISDLKLEYGASDFRLIDQTVTKTVSASRETDLFLRGYFSWLPVSRTTLGYIPNERVAGVPVYTFKKSMGLAYKGILQFSEKPLRVAMSMGAALAVASLLYGIVLGILYETGHVHAVSGWMSLMLVVLFCFGVNFILLGIIGSYLAHSISIQKERPEFVVAKEKLREL